MGSQAQFLFDDPFGKFKKNHNSSASYASDCDLHIATQSRADGSPLVITIEIADCGTVLLDDATIEANGNCKYCVKVNYDGIKDYELPRVINMLKQVYMVKKRLGKKLSFSAINRGLPYAISKDEYESLEFDFEDS